jgi:AcrR family transcriptional regulator
MCPVANAPRRYRGITAAERQAQRREQMLQAGLEVFGTEGYAASSVRSISAAAGLNSRYFYESFASKEDLLIAVYERVMSEITHAIREAVARESTLEAQTRAGFKESWTIYTSDRRKARVIALEVVGVSPRLERMRRERRHAFADLLVQNAMSVAGDGVHLTLDPVLISRALMGGVVDILVDWINGDLEVSADEIAEHFARLFTAAAYAAIDAIPPLAQAQAGAAQTTGEQQGTDEHEAANGRRTANGRQPTNGRQTTNGRRAAEAR